MSQGNESTVPAMLWWEKTVEYAFVRHILPLDSLAAPLAGDAEKFFGDLMSEDNDGQARLIEFKREDGDIKHEVVKYYPKDQVPDNQTFHGAWLEAMDNRPCAGSLGHWFVFGAQLKANGLFVLISRQYGPADAKAFKIEDDAQLGYVKPKALLEYMQRLLEKRTRGGGWSGSMVVAKLNGKSMVMNPQEFIEKTVRIQPAPKPAAATSTFEYPKPR